MRILFYIALRLLLTALPVLLLAASAARAEVAETVHFDSLDGKTSLVAYLYPVSYTHLTLPTNREV